MNLKQRANFVRDALLTRYPEPQIPLHHSDAYTFLIAVLLSAQCTDVRVNQITPLLFAKAATPDAMRKLPVQVILQIIRPCGLGPKKALAIQQLSQLLIEHHDGKVPGTFEELESLPGVGHKTASVLMSQWFGVPAFPVDTHVHRLAKRFGLSAGSSVIQTERDLKELFLPEDWRDLHLAMIFYGREECTARGCDGTKCSMCQALAA